MTVGRKVYDAHGKLLRKNTFRSHYIPDSPTTVYGPGKTPPGPYIVIPSTIYVGLSHGRSARARRGLRRRGRR